MYTNSYITTLDHHSSMLNATTRLTIRIQNLPDFAFDWEDNQPQRSCTSLTTDDFMPSEGDGIVLQERSTMYIMEFLVKHFPSLAELNQFLPCKHQIHPVKRSQVVPMKLLFKDEKQKSKTIDILTQPFSDGNIITRYICKVIEDLLN